MKKGNNNVEICNRNEEKNKVLKQGRRKVYKAQENGVIMK